jgi:hypothetical protein
MFSYQVRLRVTPLAGPAVVYDLTAIDRMRIARPVWEPDFLPKLTINRRRRNIPKGWRPRAIFAFFVDSGSASETTLQTISLAVNRQDHAVEISFDGGAAYRAVVLAAWNRYPPEDKNIGAVYEIEFDGVDLVHEDSLPPETLTGPPAIAGWA